MNIACFLLEIGRGSLPTVLGAGQDWFQTLIRLFDIAPLVIVTRRRALGRRHCCCTASFRLSKKAAECAQAFGTAG